jgi:predicted amidohydrolase YtcJ
MRACVPTIAAVLSAANVSAFQANQCAGSRDLRLTNGHIVTMDPRNTSVSEVTIQDGRFAAVGPPPRDLKLSPCTKTINLGGRTVVPGLIDNHNHIVLLGLRPGHDVRLETASSIAQVQVAPRMCPPGNSSAAWEAGIPHNSPRNGCRRSRNSTQPRSITP